MGWITQPYYEQGLAEGEAKGEVKGEAKSLTRFLEKRYGPLPAVLRERIFSADAAVIEVWLEQAFDGHDPQYIFDRN